MKKIILPLMLFFSIQSFSGVKDFKNDDLKTYTKSSHSPTEEADCIERKFKGIWKNNSIYFTITSATFDGKLSLNGKISGFTQFKNNTCPLVGTFKLTEKGTYTVDFYENSSEKFCNASFEGVISCYTNKTDFVGFIITPGDQTEIYDKISMVAI